MYIITYNAGMDYMEVDNIAEAKKEVVGLIEDGETLDEIRVLEARELPIAIEVKATTVSIG